MKAKVREKYKSLKRRFDPESKNLFKNSSWVFLSNGLGTAFAFIKMILITRILGAELLGTYTLAIAFILTTQEFLRLNISMGLIRFGAQYNSEGSKDKVVSVIKFSLLLSMGSALLSVLLLGGMVSISYETFIKGPDLTFYVIAFAFSNGLTFIDAISKASLKLFYKFKINSVIQMIMDTIEVIIIIITLYVYGPDLKAFFTATILSKVINSFTCNIAAYRELLPELRPYLSSGMHLIKSQRKEYLQYIFGNSFSSTLKVFMNQGDVLLLGYMGSLSDVAYYSTAKKLAYSVLTLSDPLASSVFPQLSHLIADKVYGKVRIMLNSITRVVILPALLFLTLAYFIKSELITLLYGPAFEPASEPFFILLICAVQGSVFFWALPLIQSLGLIKKRFLVYLSAILIGGITAMLLVHEFKSTGVALGLLAANLYINFRFIQTGILYLNKNNSLQPIT
ncbi:MAG: oligosaccharide flippase family protein [Bacteroidetes bacterium]|nr:oligosaccharide flippase family protein [Bacteroidota bacterium]